MTLSHALTVAEHYGAPIPLDLKRGPKHQYSRDTKRYHLNATTDPDKIAKWWSGAYANDGVAAKVRPLTCIVDVEPEGIDAACALGLLDIETHTERSSEGGYHLIFTIDDRGRNIKKGNLAKGIEVFYEGGHKVAVRMYEPVAHAWQFAPAPPYVLELADALNSARITHRKARPVPSVNASLDTVPEQIKLNYAYKVLRDRCDKLTQSNGKGIRHDAALEHGRVMGAVIHLGVTRELVEGMARDAMKSWPPDKFREHWPTLLDALDYGQQCPHMPAWKHADTHRMFASQHETITRACRHMPLTGKVAIDHGEQCTWRTIQRVILAIAEHAAAAQRFGVCFAAQRDIMAASGISSRRTVAKGIRAAIQLGILRKVNRKTVAWLAKFERSDKQTEANAYAFNLAKLEQIAEKVGGPDCSESGPEDAEDGGGVGGDTAPEGAKCAQNGQNAANEDARTLPSSSLSGPLSEHCEGLVTALLHAGAAPSTIAAARAIGTGTANNARALKAVGVGCRGTVLRALADLRDMGCIGYRAEDGTVYLLDGAALQAAIDNLERDTAMTTERIKRRVSDERQAYYKRRGQVPASDDVALRVEGAGGIVEVTAAGADLMGADALERLTAHAIDTVGDTGIIEASGVGALFGPGARVVEPSPA